MAGERLQIAYHRLVRIAHRVYTHRSRLRVRLRAPLELVCHALLRKHRRVHALVGGKARSDCLLGGFQKPQLQERIRAGCLAVFRHGERRLLRILQHRLILLIKRLLRLLCLLRRAVQPVIAVACARAEQQKHAQCDDPSLFHMLFFSVSFSPPIVRQLSYIV